MSPKDKARAYHLKRVYGITPEQYQEILDKQDGACVICDRKASDFHRHLDVEHSHRTGEIRGLACVNCNKFLIGSHEDPELLRKIARYLEQGTGLFVPPGMEKSKRRRRKRTSKK